MRCSHCNDDGDICAICDGLLPEGKPISADGSFVTNDRPLFCDPCCGRVGTPHRHWQFRNLWKRYGDDFGFVLLNVFHNPPFGGFVFCNFGLEYENGDGHYSRPTEVTEATLLPGTHYSGPSYLPYCGKDLCRDSITQAMLTTRQQSSEQKPAEAHAATEVATEPNEIRVCGKHIVSFAGNEPCGICGGSAETGGEKLEQSFSEALTAALYRVYPKHTISVGHVAVEMREWLANFPLRSQNQTVSSGVDGAHEGTTADKSVALAESSLSSPPPNQNFPNEVKEKSMAYTIEHTSMTEPFDELCGHLQDCCGGCPHCVGLCLQVVNEAYANVPDIRCPFCAEGDFDKAGLKSHMTSGDCNQFNETTGVVRISL